MKKTVFVLSLLLYISWANAQNILVPTAKEDNLRGKIKQYISQSYEATKDGQGRIVKGDYLGRKLQTYNPLGDNTEMSSYGSDSSLLKQSLFMRNEKGQLLEMCRYAYDIFQAVGYSKYNEKGQLVQTDHYREGKKDDWVRHTYNKNGKIAESTQYFPNDTFRESVSYKYDKHERLVEIWNITRTQNIKAVSYTYDSKGNKREMIRYRGDKIRSKTTFNNKGDISTFTSYNEDGSEDDYRRYEYPSYDAHGNWTECISYDRNDIPQRIYIRSITYYD